jgi:hypothetical protein
MTVALDVGPISEEYAAFVEDLMRIAAIMVVVHLMFVTEGREPPFDRQAISLLLYTCLGVGFYHLIIKRIFRVKRTSDPSRRVLK